MTPSTKKLLILLLISIVILAISWLFRPDEDESHFDIITPQEETGESPEQLPGI